MGVFCMFDFLFGWKKASKCKKLMKKAGCRLNVLMNKRCCVIRQQRDDVAQLVKYGYSQTAFSRVENIYTDECIVVVYHLLAHFCEFITRQLPYIRKNRDCPDEINEAISSIIFASARLAEVPELLRLRKLFRERYGECFENSALNLLQGNQVNLQIIENLSFEKVTNEEKCKLFKEITTDVLGEHLTLEFTSEEHFQATNVVDGDQCIPATEQPKPINFDISQSQLDFDHVTIDQDPLMIDHIDPESSSSDDSTTYNVPKEIVDLEDIQEFQSPLNNGKNGITDQRFFIFQSSDYDVVSLLGNDKANNQFIYFDVKELLTKGIGEEAKRLRATSMPSKRSMKCADESGAMRSYSLPVQPSPPHVHPKLPDYDEIVATFMALKKQNLEKQSRF